MSTPRTDKAPTTAFEVFAYDNGVEVRTSIDSDGEVWFVAKDVCDILDIVNVSQATSTLDVDEKGIASIYTLGGKQDMLTVNESGLYTMIITSRKPEAKKFRKWVTSEVLPALRKTGSYSVQPALTQMQIIAQMAAGMAAAEQRDLERQRQLDSIAVDNEITKDRLAQIESNIAAIPPKTQRIILGEIVKDGINFSSEGAGKAASIRWNSLYSEFLKRYSCNIKVKAKNAGMDRLEWAMHYGQMNNLIKLARHLFE